MLPYEQYAWQELTRWQAKMDKPPSWGSHVAKKVQDRINKLIPEKLHEVITVAIKNIVKAVQTGSEFISSGPLEEGSLEEREAKVFEKINAYRKVAAASGFGIGAGGFMLALADLPVLLSIKMKLLFDIAGLYGYDVEDYQERLYILHIFGIAFSTHEKCILSYGQILHWEEKRKELPEHINGFDWRTFQQEYRDYIDLAKLLQLVPGIGAVVGAVANHQLVDRLGETAMQAYRLRYFNKKLLMQ